MSSENICTTNDNFRLYLPLRRAFCASLVIASASSNMINLNELLANMVRVDANVRICSRTILIPRSSDAFNSNTIELNCLPAYNLRAHAKMVVVLPVPGTNQCRYKTRILKCSSI